MKIPLNYQRSDYDCVPVTFLNGLSYLFERAEIRPELIKAIYSFSMDNPDNDGHPGRCGTSKVGVRSLVEWINQYSRKEKFGLICEFLEGEEITPTSERITHCLERDGVMLACVSLEKADHYVLVTAIDEDYVYIFDPYYSSAKLKTSHFDYIEDKPFKMNRRVKQDVFYYQEKKLYSLGEQSKREGVLMYLENNGMRLSK
ncbi:hypothetical protein [Dendrosporobacter sp. 1207_IL3150]|uniref:hypothetical protein n=1 Tax=Dendrosporobacter sp. 1207_IL3150 TaxID=3084054 RepID=UPI002FD8AA6E